MLQKMTFQGLRDDFQAVIREGYTVITCRQFCAKRAALPPRTVVNRVDVDFSLLKARRLLDIFAELEIKATFFVRLHAPEYNPLSFENYLIIRAMVEAGHELGLHAELMDQQAIWGEPADNCLKRDLAVMREAFGVDVVGVASHRGLTPWNNLDFWQQHQAGDFGLLYEAYDNSPAFNLFGTSRYVSDSEWTQWKSYQNGVLVPGDRRTLGEHAQSGPPLLYSLIHSDTYYERHPYERD